MNIFSFRFLLIILLFTISSGLLAGNISKGKSKLKELLEQVDNKDISTIISLENEARKQSDHLCLAYAYYSKSGYYTVNYLEDSTLFYIYKGFDELRIYEEEQLNSTKEEAELYQWLKIKLVNYIVHDCLTNNKYDLALIYIDRILKDGDLGEYPVFEYEAYYLLGVCYIHAKKGKEALQSFRKAYSIYGKNPIQKPFSYHNSLRGMAHAFIILKDYDSVIVINDSIERMINRDYANNIGEAYAYNKSKYAINNEIALAQVKKGDLSNARKRLDESKEIYSEYLKESPLIHAYYEVEAQYYSAKGEHEKAKMYIDFTLDSLYSDMIYRNAYNHIVGNLIKADILHEAGDNKDAYNLLRDLYQLNDSLNAANFSSQVAEIQTLYNVDKLKLESERDKVKVRLMIYVLIGSFLLLLLLTYIIYVAWRNAQILKKKNKQLFNQYSEIEKNNKRIQALQLQQTPNVDDEKTEENLHEVLIHKLNAYLEESQVYTNPNLTREELALDMGTNRQYLIEAIKEQTGKTYNEYIYSFRLKYAYSMIVNNKMKSIGEIYLEAGFTTKGTFNRAFKEAYGMTPSELRTVID